MSEAPPRSSGPRRHTPASSGLRVTRAAKRTERRRHTRAAPDRAALLTLLPEHLVGVVERLEPITLGLSGAGVHAVTTSRGAHVLRVQGRAIAGPSVTSAARSGMLAAMRAGVWVLLLATAACGRRARPEETTSAPPQPPTQDGWTGTVLAKPDAATIVDIALDATHAYWIEESTDGVSTIARAPKSGGAAPEAVGRVGKNGCRRLALDDAKVYCLTDDGTFAIPKLGGAGVTLGPRVDCLLACALAVDADALFVSQPNGIARVPKSGGAARMVGVDSAQASAIALTPTHVYWASPLRPEHPSAIRRVAKSGGTTETLVPDASLLAEDMPLFVDGGRAHWVEGIELRSCAITGGSARDELLLDGVGVRGVAMDSGDVYWGRIVHHIGAPSSHNVNPASDPWGRRQITDPGGHAQGQGGLMFRPKSGAASEVIREHPDVELVALDAAAVYWVESKTSTLRTLPRKRR